MLFFIKKCELIVLGQYFDIFFVNSEAPEDNFLTIFRGSSEMVDFCHLEMFLTIFRGPSGIHPNCHFNNFRTIFHGSRIYPPTPSAVERARSAGPSLRPSGLQETAGRHDGCSLQAIDQKTFRYIGPQGRSLKATGVATSCDKFRQVATSCD